MDFKVPTMAEMMAKGEQPDILFWVGCAGSFDERAQKITKDIAKILNHVGMKYAILGTEESCTGDPAKRAGNEFLFQMQAMSNIELLNAYEVKKIVTACPHCFNTLKNEYPELGGHYEVIHHTQLIQDLINEGKLAASNGESFKGKRITYHDPCYLGRYNQVYNAPRKVIKNALKNDVVEMSMNKQSSFCCGAGGGRMFMEEHIGKRINHERTEQAILTNAKTIATACPFCMTMMNDGVKDKGLGESIEVKDIAELVADRL